MIHCSAFGARLVAHTAKFVAINQLAIITGWDIPHFSPASIPVSATTVAHIFTHHALLYRHLAALLTSNDAAARLAASEAVVALAVGRQAVCQDALTATEPLVKALVSLLTGPEATSVQAVVAIR